MRQEILSSFLSGNGSSPGLHRAITWNNAVKWTPTKKFIEIWMKIQAFNSRQWAWQCRLQNFGHAILASKCCVKVVVACPNRPHGSVWSYARSPPIRTLCTLVSVFLIKHTTACIHRVTCTVNITNRRENMLRYCLVADSREIIFIVVVIKKQNKTFIVKQVFYRWH